MAKQKTKKVPFDVTATEVQPGVWEWTVHEVTWRYHEGMGINLYANLEGEGEYAPVAYFKNIQEAGYFVQGWCAGRSYGQREGKPVEAT